MNRTHLIIGATLLAVSSSTLNAAVISTFQDNVGREVGTRWRYYYNTGPIGNSAQYTPLLSSPEALTYWWDGDGVRGVSPLPDSPSANIFGYVNFGLVGVEGPVGGHPGRGSAQSSDGLSHYAIAAYTLATASPVSISSSLLTTISTSLDGVDVLVYHNNQLKNSSSTTPWTPSAQVGASTTFDGFLGELAAGDTIYVAIGSQAYDNYDAFTLRYSLTDVNPEATVVPEPASLGLALAALPLLRRRR